ncbi:hypothetical protein Sme01_03750 [Sphaerisporangium melleum]|uniref:Uncharacterized protein n=1 Tax=Sphaerisporangium melleum TaxID=321316 RepID=A0A917QQB1_9ACTN|nr:hypothetical protein [Sphaerisporangium melleum]GGK61882.1 hypothetical protein GCM10007964_01300 [Sphaerisporangium melleum]GII67899.1 hypothetical protein Sme01_03750 [Sphaerisporangium melleum]
MTHHLAPLELAEFLAATRPDWERMHIQQAIERARQAAWPYEHFVGAFWRTACDDDATPAEVDHLQPKNLRREWAVAS